MGVVSQRNRIGFTGKDSGNVKISNLSARAFWGLLAVSCLAGCSDSGRVSSSRFAADEKSALTSPPKIERATEVNRTVSSESQDSKHTRNTEKVVKTSGLILPPIHLSKQHEATCVVKQGDALPDFELQDTDGKKHQLSSLLGERLTAVCFWSGKSPAAVQQLLDMEPEILDTFADKGLAVVAINYGDEAGTAKRMVKQIGFTAPLLLDPKGTAFSQVATHHLPRTYLLDENGKVVWFDLEYSPSTRRHLRQAIEYSLAQP